jgi:hypothetical protein
VAGLIWSWSGLVGQPRSMVSATCDGTWHVRATPTNHDFQLFHAVSAASAGEAWAVGTYTDFGTPPAQPLMEHWDGSAWTELDGPFLPDGGDLWGVAAFSPTDVWAVGGRSEIPGRTLVEHWDGSVWSVVPSPSPGQGSTGSGLVAVAALSATDVWAVGIRSSRDLVLTLVEHWDGFKWSAVKSPNVADDNTNELLSVAAISTDDVWAAGFAEPDVGSVSSTLIERWDGTRWKTFPSPNATGLSNVLEALSAASSTDAWAVGTHEDYFGDNLSLTEHWDGSRWAIVSSPSPGGTAFMYGVSALLSGTAWIAGTGGGGPMSWHWNGTRWKAISGEKPGDLSNQFFAVAALADLSVWAVGDWANNQGPIHTLVEYLC